MMGNGGQGTPSPLSPTPSPASSVGSQSSGYSSGELRAPGVAPLPAPCTPIPLSVHTALQKHTHTMSLVQCHDLWEQADMLVYKGKHRGEKS